MNYLVFSRNMERSHSSRCVIVTRTLSSRQDRQLGSNRWRYDPAPCGQHWTGQLEPPWPYLGQLWHGHHSLPLRLPGVRATSDQLWLHYTGRRVESSAGLWWLVGLEIMIFSASVILLCQSSMWQGWQIIPRCCLIIWRTFQEIAFGDTLRVGWPKPLIKSLGVSVGDQI